ncbi:MAG: hypothetical protein ACODAG_12865 [Myxococcota bacterium]
MLPPQPVGTHATADPPRPGFHLRLDSTNGRLELARPLRRGPLSLNALTVSIGPLEDPVDLAAGALTFRHRRGRLLHMDAAVDLRAAEQAGVPVPRELPVVDGVDLLYPPSAPFADALSDWEVPVRREEERLHLVRPLQTLLCELLVPHGWRVPDERGTIVSVTFDEPWIIVQAER